MPLWTIRLIDLRAESRAKSDEGHQIPWIKQQLINFSVLQDRSQERIPKEDPHFMNASIKNSNGLRSALKYTSAGHYAFEVIQTTSNVAYLMGKLKIINDSLEINEVINNAFAPGQLADFRREVERDAALREASSNTWLNKLADDIKNDIDDNQPFKCLCAWAARAAPTVTTSLVANTLGLVDYYQRKGFELAEMTDSSKQKHYEKYRNDYNKAIKALEEDPNNREKLTAKQDFKYSEINADMVLKRDKIEALLNEVKPLVQYIGPDIFKLGEENGNLQLLEKEQASRVQAEKRAAAKLSASSL